MDKYLLGIEIGGTKLQLYVADFNGLIVKRIKHEIGSEKKASVIRNKISHSIMNDLSVFKICAIGIGFGGPININTGEIINSFQVDGWSGFNIVEWLNNITDLPIFVENDANLAAYAEAIKGAGKDSKTIFYNTLGSGAGAGLIINKHIFHGSTCGESEFGHIKLNKESTSVESQCSGWAINEKIKNAVIQFPQSTLAKLVYSNNSCESKYLIPAINKKCPVAQGILSELANNLALGYSHVIHILNPDKIIIGGGLSLMGNPLIEAIKTAIPKYVMPPLLPGPEICLSELGEDVVVVGAIHLALEKYKTNNK